MQSAKPVFDVLVVGAGPAGLSAAGALARQLLNTVVFDSGVYRNRYTKHMHNVAGYDHVDPAVFRAKARADLLTRYTTIRFEDNTTISSLAKNSDGLFEAREDATGRTWVGRKVVLATGVSDVFPANIKNYANVWGSTVFHCLFCHGFEERGASSAGLLADGMLADPKAAAHVAKLTRRLAHELRIYTNGNAAVTETMKNLFAGDSRVTIEPRRVVELQNINAESEAASAPERGAQTQPEAKTRQSLLVTLEDGTQLHEGFMAHAPKVELNGPFVQQLGLALTEGGDIAVSQPFNETSVPGVFAAGDIGTAMKSVVVAMTTGTVAGVGATSQL